MHVLAISRVLRTILLAEGLLNTHCQVENMVSTWASMFLNQEGPNNTGSAGCFQKGVCLLYTLHQAFI